MNASPGPSTGGFKNNLIGKKQQLVNQTLDVEDDKAQSVADNISQGGTRYIVGIKGGNLKFYG